MGLSWIWEPITSTTSEGAREPSFPGPRRPESGYCSVNSPLSPSIYPANQPAILVWTAANSGGSKEEVEQEEEEEEERELTLPERQNRCQSNSTTCADIKHYCILTFHMNCNSAFSQKPAKWGLRKALCLWAVWGLICDSHITSFHSVRGKIYGRRHASDLTLPRRCSAVKK